MGDMDPEFRAEVQTKKFKQVWSRYAKKKGSLRLCKAIMRAYWGERRSELRSSSGLSCAGHHSSCVWDACSILLVPFAGIPSGLGGWGLDARVLADRRDDGIAIFSVHALRALGHLHCKKHTNDRISWEERRSKHFWVWLARRSSQSVQPPRRPTPKARSSTASPQIPLRCLVWDIESVVFSSFPSW